MLPREEDGLEPMKPEEAVEELLARMLEYRRYREASGVLVERFEAERGFLYRSAPLPAHLRRVAVDAAVAVYDPARLGSAIGDLLREPEEVDVPHIRPTVSLQRRLRVLRDALERRRELRLRRGVRQGGPADPGGDDLRPARPLQQRRGDLGAEENFGPIRGAARRPREWRGGVNDLSRTVEALLFLSPDPVSIADLAEATEATEGQVAEAIELLSEDFAEGKRGMVLRVIGGGFALAAIRRPRTPRAACSPNRAPRR